MYISHNHFVGFLITWFQAIIEPIVLGIITYFVLGEFRNVVWGYWFFRILFTLVPTMILYRLFLYIDFVKTSRTISKYLTVSINLIANLLIIIIVYGNSFSFDKNNCYLASLITSLLFFMLPKHSFLTEIE